MNFPRITLATASTAVALLLGPAAGQALAKPSQPVCPGPASKGSARCHARVVTDHSGRPLASSGPTGYGPAQFHGAYNLPQQASGNQTIAIVDAYDDPTIRNDLSAYSTKMGIPDLPTCSSTVTSSCFAKLNQSGNSGSYPSKNSGWALEIALDVEAAHAVCQNCKIVLVEANSNSFSNLSAAVKTAANKGANAISNSYGGGEYSGENDSAYKQTRRAVTVSSGDSGYRTEFPASSPNVVAVGGTTLTATKQSDGSYSYGGEKVWNGTGSGCSAFLSAQSWQTNLSEWSNTSCDQKRGVADVAADADPSTGAAVYDTTKYQGRSGWFQVGGTSLSAPLIAAVYALAANADSTDYPASLPYANQNSLHDITSGTNGNCATIMCSAHSGYDGPTGVGTPNGTSGF
ncbi:MAG: peptidase S8 [Solirubrobacteraceae bacterium]